MQTCFEMPRYLTIAAVACAFTFTVDVHAGENPVQTTPLRVLNADSFAHHIDHFNAMEDESVVNIVPNAESWAWLRANVPFFTCDDPDM